MKLVSDGDKARVRDEITPCQEVVECLVVHGVFVKLTKAVQLDRFMHDGPAFCGVRQHFRVNRPPASVEIVRQPRHGQDAGHAWPNHAVNSVLMSFLVEIRPDDARQVHYAFLALGLTSR